MATTIITKHGTGVPSSLEVGELAIDKAEPAIYTNTGTGVEKIATASSGGGGGGGTQYPISDAANPGTLITFTGNQASNFVYDYNTTDFTLKVANGGQLSPTDMITMTLPSTHMFHIVPTADKNDIGTTDPGVGAKLGGYFVAFSNPPIKMTLHDVNGESGSNRNLVSNMSAQSSIYVSFKGADANTWTPSRYSFKFSMTCQSITLATTTGRVTASAADATLHFANLMILPA